MSIKPFWFFTSTPFKSVIEVIEEESGLVYLRADNDGEWAFVAPPQIPIEGKVTAYALDVPEDCKDTTYNSLQLITTEVDIGGGIFVVPAETMRAEYGVKSSYDKHMYYYIDSTGRFMSSEHFPYDKRYVFMSVPIGFLLARRYQQQVNLAKKGSSPQRKAPISTTENLSMLIRDVFKWWEVNCSEKK